MDELVKRHLVLVALLNDTQGLGLDDRRAPWLSELAAIRAILRERYGKLDLPVVEGFDS